MVARALAASPLFMGGDLALSSDEAIRLITHPEILAADRNGVVGHQVFFREYIDVRHSPARGNPGHGWIGVFNRHCPWKCTLTRDDLGLPRDGRFRLTDCWIGAPIDFTGGKLEVDLEEDDVLFLKYQPKV
jgi:hypothetical protein